MMFENAADISRFVQKGDNVIEIELTASNRNLLGPHHCLEDESLSVAPNTFEMNDTWNNGKSSEYTDNYLKTELCKEIYFTTYGTAYDFGRKFAYFISQYAKSHAKRRDFIYSRLKKRRDVLSLLKY